MMQVLSLGAGVQSTTLALMAAAGEITPMPDAAIFSDTQWEPKAVYAHLDELEKLLPFPVYRVSAGDLRRNVIEGSNPEAGRFIGVPFFTEAGGIGRRQCTEEFKLKPIRRKLRELLGKGPKERVPKRSVIMWIGISLDEAIRMKPAKEQWLENRWPLIEHRMSRRDCMAWLASHGNLVPPKSSCIGCPYHSNAMWRDMRDNSPEEWRDAVEVDAALRQRGKVRGYKQNQFMHRSLVPLDKVDLSTHEERGQPDLFMNDCEGMCGV